MFLVIEANNSVMKELLEHPQAIETNSEVVTRKCKYPRKETKPHSPSVLRKKTLCMNPYCCGTTLRMNPHCCGTIYRSISDLVLEEVFRFLRVACFLVAPDLATPLLSSSSPHTLASLSDPASPV